MKALVKTGRGEGFCEITEWPRPAAGPNEVLIQVEWAGVCGTDLSVYLGTANYTVPLVMGHEFSGTIVAAGEGVRSFAEGDRVIGETSIDTCGTCRNCVDGFYNVCPQRLGMGRTAKNGAFAEYINLDYRLVHKIPSGLPSREASLGEPAAAAHHAVVERGGVGAGDRVYVLGPGPMGILSGQIALARGARVLVAGLPQDADRLKRCEDFGCEIVTLEGSGGIEKLAAEHAGQADVVMECSGSPQAFQAALEIVRPRGRCVQVGIFKHEITVNLNRALAKEATILGSYSSVWADFEAVLDLAARGKINLAALISGVYPLAEWRQAFDLAKSGQAIKVLIHP